MLESNERTQMENLMVIYNASLRKVTHHTFTYSRKNLFTKLFFTGERVQCLPPCGWVWLHMGCNSVKQQCVDTNLRPGHRQMWAKRLILVCASLLFGPWVFVAAWQFHELWNCRQGKVRKMFASKLISLSLLYCFHYQCIKQMATVLSCLH